MDADPATTWAEDAKKLRPSSQTALRLAAMAGHMRVDRVAARRAALMDLLADGRPHSREDIWARIAAHLGADCWGKRPQEALARDLAVLRSGGIRIAYSRRPGATGYYLQHPPLRAPSTKDFAVVRPELVEAIRG